MAAGCHEVQPCALATHCSAFPFAQRVAPAVHELLQVWQLPLLQVLPLVQLCVVQVVQPSAASSWQTWRAPVPLQTAAP